MVGMADRWVPTWLIALLIGSAACDGRSSAGAPSQSTETEDSVSHRRRPPEYWASRLNDGSAAVRREALAHLGEAGRAASSYASIVVPLLADPDEKTGFTAAWTLVHMGMSAHPLLIARLESPIAEERERAAYGVGEMGPAGAAAADQLMELQNDPNPEVRNMAAWALKEVTVHRMVADPNMLLTEGLDGSREERLDAIDRLGVNAHSSRVAIRELIALLGDSVPAIRARAVTALSQAGAAALPSLSAALSHRNKEVRRGALLAISRMHRVF
jgi:HEAT repeat protein